MIEYPETTCTHVATSLNMYNTHAHTHNNNDNNIHNSTLHFPPKRVFSYVQLGSSLSVGLAMRPVLDRVSREFAGLGGSFCSFSSVSSPSVSCTGSLTRCLWFRQYDPSEVSTTCDCGAVSSTTIPEVSWSRIYTVSPGSNNGSSLALWHWSWFCLCLSLMWWFS